jgi:hypothetical protein
MGLRWTTQAMRKSSGISSSSSYFHNKKWGKVATSRAIQGKQFLLRVFLNSEV